MQQLPKAPFQDSNFKRIVVVSTALGFAFMVGLISSIQGKNAQGLVFGWHWPVLVWIAAAVLSNAVFWRVAGNVQANPSPGNKKRFILGCLFMGAIGVAAFLYPMRFSEKSFTHWFSLIKGLVTAVIFLGICGWIFYKFCETLNQADEVELKRHEK
ncbi:MAG: hypothetical protein ACO1QB_14655 [Verrucomicrobiales bacterium]